MGDRPLMSGRSSLHDRNATGDARAFDHTVVELSGVPTHLHGVATSVTLRACFDQRGTAIGLRHTDDDSDCRFETNRHLGAHAVPPCQPLSLRSAVAGAEPRDDGLRVASRLPPRFSAGDFYNRAFVSLRRPRVASTPASGSPRPCASRRARTASSRRSPTDLSTVTRSRRAPRTPYARRHRRRSSSSATARR